MAMSSAVRKEDPPRRRPLTPAEQRNAELLEKAWDKVKSRRKISQKEMATRYDSHPSIVSQYINGHIPLNPEWQLKFAQYLRVSPQSIWPDWRYQDVAPGRLPPDAVEVALAWSNLDETSRGAITTLIESLSGKRA